MNNQTDQAFVVHEVIDGITLNVNDIRCPRCRNNTLVLLGQAQIPQTEIMEDGVITEVLPGEYIDGSFDLEELDCLTCNIKFIVKDHALFQLERENDKLREKLRNRKTEIVH